MQGQGGLTGRFRSKNFHDSSLGQSADTQGHIQLDASGADDRDIDDFLAPQSHDGPFTVILFDLRHGGVEGPFPVGYFLGYDLGFVLDGHERLLLEGGV
jgi:hypothetical protein